jgi:aminomethyltransferase
MTDPDLKFLPLKSLHETAGARFGAFAGWSMPLTYTAGVMKEHQQTREAAGLFDISHMKLFELSGPGAEALVARACPLQPQTMGEGQSRYTFLLDEQSGILDDLIVTRLGATRFMIVANAGNADADERHLRAIAEGFECAVTALDRVFIAVQGPKASDVLARVLPEIDLSQRRFMTGFEPRDGWFVTRSGYTGEDGFEIAVPVDDAAELAAKLEADPDTGWVGLAARDSLRLEAGLCLHGQDITRETSPVAAGLLWAIPKPLRSEGQFVGAEALHRLVALGAPERRVGLRPDGRQPVRAGAVLTDAAGAAVGRVTSGGFGPSVGHPVAMGYVPTTGAEPGTRYFADVRGTKVPVDVHPLPFFQHRSLKG